MTQIVQKNQRKSVKWTRLRPLAWSLRAFTFGRIPFADGLHRSRSVGLTAFAIGKSFSPFPQWLKSQTAQVADKKRISALWAFLAKSAQEIDDKAYRQDQANPTAADDGTAKVKPAAAEQEKQYNYE